MGFCIVPGCIDDASGVTLPGNHSEGPTKIGFGQFALLEGSIYPVDHKYDTSLARFDEPLEENLGVCASVDEAGKLIADAQFA